MAPANFDPLTHLYRWAEWFSFGPILSQCRRAFLPQMKGRQTALVIGDGDGRFTKQLLQQNPRMVVEAVDSSKEMLHQLTRRAEAYRSRLITHNMDARDFMDARNFVPSNCRYDLIVTHFFLDCLTTEEVARLATRLREGVSDDALWVVSDFAVPRTLFGRVVAKLLVSILYMIFGMLTGLRVRQLPDHPAALQKAGFKLMQRRPRLCGLLVSELWQQAGDGRQGPSTTTIS